jgi:homoserine kinase type II
MAVYTDVSFEDLEEFLTGYDIGCPRSFKGIAEGVENSNFHLQTDRGGYILTLYEKRVSKGDLHPAVSLARSQFVARRARPGPN